MQYHKNIQEPDSRLLYVFSKYLVCCIACILNNYNLSCCIRFTRISNRIRTWLYKVDLKFNVYIYYDLAGEG